MKLEKHGALDLPSRSKGQLQIKLVSLKQLEKEINDKYKDAEDKLKALLEEKQKYLNECNEKLSETIAKAVKHDDFVGLYIKRTHSYSYIDEILLSHPQANEFTKTVIDKTALRKFVKENGSVEGFADDVVATRQIDIDKVAIEIFGAK